MDIDNLIYKKLNGTATKEETIQLIEWIKKDGGNKLLFQALETNWKGDATKVKEYKKEVWDNLETRIAPSDHAFTKPDIKAHVFTKALKYIPRVAAVLFIISATLFLFYFADNELYTAEDKNAKPNLITKHNVSGVKSTVTLPDKSKVILNSESTLTFPEAFTERYRQVTLKGEAFFEVTENAARPFIVITEGLTTEVKGTTFNINAYNKEIFVAVERGLVSTYTGNDQGLYIHPGEMAVYTPETSSKLKKRAFEPSEIAWKEGVIIFENASFLEVKQMIQRWYGVEVILEREITFKEGFNGSFRNATLKSVMESISFAGKFEYQIDYKNDRLTIK